MTSRLSYTVTVQLSDGSLFEYQGSQVIADQNPTTTDLTNATTAMAADILAQTTTGPSSLPNIEATDSTND